MKNLSFILAFLFFTQATAQDDLCTQFGNTPIDITIDTWLSSGDIDFSTWTGKHVHITSNGKISINSDIILESVTIQVDGSSKIAGYNILDVDGKTIEFNDCRVYTCNSYSFFVHNTLEAGPSIKVTNSRFEGYGECIHVSDAKKFDVENSTFIGKPFGHAIHVDGQWEASGDYPEVLTFRNNHFEGQATAMWLDRIESGLIIENNEFINCQSHAFHMTFGTYTDSKSVVITDNKFTNCGVGFTTATNGQQSNHGGFDGTMIVNNNEFTNVGLAIDIGPLNGNIRINNNTMNNYTVDAEGFYYGIGGLSHIFRNEINVYTTPLFSSPMIDISGAGQAVIDYNQFTGPQYSSFIKLSGHQLAKMKENTSNGGTFDVRGIDDLSLQSNEVDALGGKICYGVELSQSTFCNNIGKDAGVNFSFQGNCMNSDLRSNDIGPGHIGLYVDDVIGRQEHTGNIWATAYINEGATNTSTDVDLSLITANNDPAQGGNVRYIPTTFSPSNWFDNDDAVAQIANCAGPFGPHFPHDKKKLLTGVDGLVINNQYNVTQLSNWLADRNLLRKLIANPTLLSDPSVYAWFTNQSNTNVMYISEIEHELIDFYGTEAEIQAINALMDSKMSIINTLSSMSANDPLYSSTVSNLEPIDNQLSTALSAITAAQVTILSAVDTKLQLISNPNDYELLFKDIYTVYIKYLDDSDYEPTNAELTMISDYANLCPLTYGPSLYIARALANVYRIVYDEENCSNTFTRSTSMATRSTGLDALAAPEDRVNALDIPSDIEKVELFDLNGRLVKTEVGSRTLNHPKLTNGLYVERTWYIGAAAPQSRLITIFK